MTLEHTATREGKLLSFLRGEMGLSYGLVKRLKWREAYRVDGVLAHVSRVVRVGERITVALDEDAPDIPAEDGQLSILYEDEALLAVDKPAGLITHPTFHRIDGTLANRVAGYYARSGQPSAVHFVNRLDRDTCGVVLMAKNAHLHAALCAQMRSGGIRKAYRAAVFGGPTDDGGFIRHPIARLSQTSLLRCVREGGRASETEYAVLSRGGECAQLALWPHTGRTHQLRVHCAHEGFPILGDAQYGTEASLAFSRARGIAVQQLCAVSLAFAHPMTGEPVEIHSRMAVWED